jgi:hypothetical protein
MDAEQPGTADVLRAVLDELLGAHPDTRQAILVSAAFFGRLASEPKVAAILTDGDDEIRELGAAAVREAQDAGQSRPGALTRAGGGSAADAGRQLRRRRRGRSAHH